MDPQRPVRSQHASVGFRATHHADSHPYDHAHPNHHTDFHGHIHADSYADADKLTYTHVHEHADLYTNENTNSDSHVLPDARTDKYTLSSNYRQYMELTGCRICQFTT